jgi:MarR family transcriptional regulator, lower aerobic nicotinate degradation pathway regulator
MSVPAIDERMETHTGYRLVKLGTAAGALFDECLGTTGMRPRHVRVLGYIHDGQHSQQDLCRLTGMDRTTMVAVVDDLERLGYARREPSSTDRRKRVVTPTPKGGRALVEAAEQLREAEERLLAPLTAKERRQLGTLVGKLFTPELLRC